MLLLAVGVWPPHSSLAASNLGLLRHKRGAATCKEPLRWPLVPSRSILRIKFRRQLSAHNAHDDNGLHPLMVQKQKTHHKLVQAKNEFFMPCQPVYSLAKGSPLLPRDASLAVGQLACQQSSRPLLHVAHASFKGAGDTSSSSFASSSASSSSRPFLSTAAALLRRLKHLISGALLAAALLLLMLPQLLSWDASRLLLLSAWSRSIPGTISVQAASLGWLKQVDVKGLSIQAEDGRPVLSVPQISSEASLMSIVAGQSGLGNTRFSSASLDLSLDAASGAPHLHLALFPTQSINPRRRLPLKPSALESSDVAASGEIITPRGSLWLEDASVKLPADAASVLGEKVFLRVLVGSSAVEQDEKAFVQDSPPSGLPVVARIVSQHLLGEVAGRATFELWGEGRGWQLKLLRPAELKMDASPAISRHLLGKINPLLANVVGAQHPAGMQPLDTGVADVAVVMCPANMRLPAKETDFNISPMSLSLGRGPLLDGIVRLLSVESIPSTFTTMQTSAIVGHFNSETGWLRCNRFDTVIGGTVHVASWGAASTLNNSKQLVLAIPATTLQRYLKLPANLLPADFYLQIPVSGEGNRLEVDWQRPATDLALVAMSRKLGLNLPEALMNQDDVPAAPSSVPWQQ